MHAKTGLAMRAPACYTKIFYDRLVLINCAVMTASFLLASCHCFLIQTFNDKKNKTISVKRLLSQISGKFWQNVTIYTWK